MKVYFKRTLLVLLLLFAGILIICLYYNKIESNRIPKKINDSLKTEKVNSDDKQSIEVYAMDTYMTLYAYGSNAKAALMESKKKILQLDSLFNTTNSESEIYQLNCDKKIIASKDVIEILKEAKKISDLTDGKLDLSVYPIVEEWGFINKKFCIPTDNRLEELKKNVSYKKIFINEKTSEVRLDNKSMKIDLGAVAKGYTSKMIMKIFKKHHIKSGLVSLGGNVQIYGKKPDNSLFKIGIANPEKKATNYLGVYQGKDKAVITSGSYERYFEKNNKIYHHIIDPATAKPAESGIVSMTIIADDGTLADGLSTSCFILGKDKTLQLWRNNKEKFDFILQTADKKIYISKNLESHFNSENNYEIIE